MKLVGRNIRKIDGMAITTGKPVYTEDMVVAGALKVKILRSPHAFAKILSIDTSRAEKLEGVELVLTYKDIEPIRFTLAGQTAPEPSPYDRYILEDMVRYVGDEVAIVAAVDERTAKEALRLIKVEYEKMEPVIDFEKAIGHPSVVHPETDLHCNFDIGLNQLKNIASHQEVIIGDMDEVMKNCDVIVEETTYNQAQAHCMMETYRAFTYMDHMERLVIVSSTQVPFHVRRHMARILNIPTTRVRVIKPRIGGGFGGKQTATAEIFAAVVTMKTGKPAVIVYDRKETFESSTTRHAMRVKVRIGANRDGIIKAIDIEGLSDTGAYGEHASTVFGLVASKTLPLYNKTEAVRFIGDVVYTNKTPGGAFRGYGATQGTLAVETTINKLAKVIGMDPTTIRLKNLIKEGETNLIFNGQALGSSTLHACIRKGKEIIGWNEKYPKVDLGNGKVRGYGMAVTMQGSGIAGIDTASVDIRLDDNGCYTMLIGSTDMGTGSDTILAQMAAEVLETELENITVHAADTDISPYDPGSYASSTTYVTGMAVVKACNKLRMKIMSQGAKFLGVSKDDVTFDGREVMIDHGYTTHDQGYLTGHGEFLSSGEPKSITLKRISELTLTWTGKSQLTGTATFGSNISPPPFIAGFAEVEVDLPTGEVKLIQSINVVDCGTAINPNLVRVQAEGGAAQSIGLALFEEVQYTEQGQLMNNSFMQYKIPARNDIGKIVVELIESYEPTGPFGAKSVGEVVANTAAPAIVDAVFNATGVRVTKLPITAEKVFFGMKCNESHGASNGQ